MYGIAEGSDEEIELDHETGDTETEEGEIVVQYVGGVGVFQSSDTRKKKNTKGQKAAGKFKVLSSTEHLDISFLRVGQKLWRCKYGTSNRFRGLGVGDIAEKTLMSLELWEPSGTKGDKLEVYQKE
ncbi:hypothetical protein NDU88_004427 [Pleurodeles waltl]|uniref:Uncharacterized protein n=1 Tax=Pleurodeles waltl TaxID=8319 RepID=A0AAV7VKS3_PLEWA|nr:hypothetical protein NDU88_004427 [Pleurodeles waltl]